MKNFINTVVVSLLAVGLFATAAHAEAKTEAVAEAKTEAKEAEPTVRQNLKLVLEVDAEDIHRAAGELEVVLDTTIKDENEEMKEKAPHLFKVAEQIAALEGGNSLRQEVGAALKRGIVARASGVPEAELRLGTPRNSNALLRHTVAEAELDELLNPSIWDKLKWWWKG